MEYKEGDYFERSFGKFERTISLPKDIKDDNVEAKYENGVLTVTIEKQAKAQPKLIKIK